MTVRDRPNASAGYPASTSTQTARLTVRAFESSGRITALRSRFVAGMILRPFRCRSSDLICLRTLLVLITIGEVYAVGCESNIAGWHRICVVYRHERQTRGQNNHGILHAASASRFG